MKKAIIYARYSSDSQTEQSIEGQLRVCQQYAKNNDILIVDTYIDRAMTGTNDARPDFQRMIKDSSKHQWDYVLVYKLDRFSRNKYEATIHKHTLKENGVKILSAMENIPDTPEGIILESMLEGMNQYFSAELSQKVLRGLKESYIKGNFTGGVQLYGYDVVDMKNVINPNEADIVREIFTKYAQGYTAVDISNDLKNRGIRTKKGKYITTANIYKMLLNTKYNGKAKHGDIVYTNIYPAIVDDITWQRVQDIRNSNKHAPGRKKDIYEFLLSGKLICGDCKATMIGESGTSHTGDKYYYYSCLSRRRKKHKCNFKSLNKQYLEDLVIHITWLVLCENTTIAEIAKWVIKRHEQINKQNDKLKSLENTRLSVLKASNNLIAAIEQGIITEQTKNRLKELEAQISQLDFDIEQEKQRSYTFLTQDKIEQYLKSVLRGDIEAIAIRKHIVKTFIRDIIVYADKILITYNFTEHPPIKGKNSDSYEDIEMQAQSPAFSLNRGSFSLETFLPLQKDTFCVLSFLRKLRTTEIMTPAQDAPACSLCRCFAAT
ncbi:MAG: recombinase family protein [Clostridia bacterium]|nr:recombinase family protein [Clostridia bacterium]